MLDNIEYLLKVIISNNPTKNKYLPNLEMDIYTFQISLKEFGEMYCPCCGDLRKMSINNIYMPLRHSIDMTKIRLSSTDKDSISICNNAKISPEETYDELLKQLSNSLWEYKCLQCDTSFISLIYNTIDGQRYVVFSSCEGGLTTPNTPKSVSYYLDQASRCQSAGANSAAMAMYRSALEHILYEQNYKDGMLGNKIGKLSKDIDEKIAPQWAMELEKEYLKCIKDLGNSAIHVNDGNVEQQSVLDTELLTYVSEVFRMLLFKIYEVPNKEKSLLQSLISKAKSFKIK